MGEVTKLATSDGPSISSPSLITASHDLSAFDCGREPLNDWLVQHALKGEGRSARTYVVAHGQRVVGYYCLSAGGASHDQLHRKVKRNTANPTPVLVLGRLGVDRGFCGRGIGGGLLKDAMLRAVEANRIVGCAALIVHALDDEAMQFYLPYGFQQFPLGTKTLFLPIETIISGL